MSIFENVPKPRPNYIHNGRVITDNCVAIYKEGFVHVSGIPKLFNQFNEGEKNMKLFLNGEFAWVAPNADITPFQFDPFTGEKIDWDWIKSVLLH